MASARVKHQIKGKRESTNIITPKLRTRNWKMKIKKQKPITKTEWRQCRQAGGTGAGDTTLLLRVPRN
ncbi:unnamed protein product [Prunus armeniaca]|uniref:Uncharacterized protein n=1 Tax=Prunus armeniaca TaxID=36596 RepID=A0A6J5XZL7_PRUAR|nr:unnamed protein product [Prunus armeniaca]CAB4317175.1 unnamed protein product [Prunus armeniaca]